MKKIYTLLAAMLCASATLTAQNISVTLDGMKIENGSTVEKYYEADQTWDEDLGAYKPGLYPEILFSSTVNGNVDATVKSLDNNEDVGFCWGEVCEMTLASKEYIATKLGVSYNKVLHGEQNLNIDVMHDTPWTENYTREIELTITQRGETFTCKIILGVDKEKALNITDMATVKPVSYAGNTLSFSLNDAVAVTVYSVTGSDVLTESVAADGSVSLANLPKGVYIYSAKSAGKNYTGKVVVK